MVVVYNIYCGKRGVGGDNGVEESIDCGEGGCVGPYLVVYFYSVSSYRPFHSPLPKSIYLVPPLLDQPLETSGGASLLAERITGSRHLRVARSFLSSCSSASVHSLPCGP